MSFSSIFKEIMLDNRISVGVQNSAIAFFDVPNNCVKKEHHHPDVLALEANLTTTINTVDALQEQVDAVPLVSNWASFHANSEVNLGSNNINGNKAIMDDVQCGYLRLPKSGDVKIELNSFTNTGTMPKIKLTGSNNKYVTQSIESVNGLDVLQFTASDADMGIYIDNNTALFMPNGALQSRTLNSERLTLTSATGTILNIKSATSSLASLKIDNDDNTIINETNATLSGFNNVESKHFIIKNNDITIDDITLKQIGSELNCDGVFLANGIHSNGTIGSSGELYTTGDLVQLCRDDIALTNILTVSKTSNLISSDTNASLYGFNDVGCASIHTGTLYYTALDPALPVVLKPTYDYWVSPNGSDSATGNQTDSFLTIQHAINVCESFTDNVHRTVHIYNGNYQSETLTVSKGRLTLKGEGSNQYVNVQCAISNVNINITTGQNDLFNVKVELVGLLIAGSVLDTTDNTPHVLSIVNCMLYSDIAIHQNSSSSIDCRTYIDRCLINAETSNGVNALVRISRGMFDMMNCQLNAKGNQNVLLIDGNARTGNVVLNGFSSSTNVVNPKAICEVGTTLYNSVKSFANNTFIYSSSSSKSSVSPNFSTGIFVNAPQNSMSLLYLYNNLFSLNGSTGNDFIVNGLTASSMLVFHGGNYSSSSNASVSASTIAGTLNATKFGISPVS